MKPKWGSGDRLGRVITCVCAQSPPRERPLWRSAGCWFDKWIHIYVLTIYIYIYNVGGRGQRSTLVSIHPEW